MYLEDIKNIIQEVVSNQLEVNLKEINSKELFKDIGADSLDMIEIFMQLEVRLKIEFLQADILKIINYEQLLKVVKKYIKEKYQIF